MKIVTEFPREIHEIVNVWIPMSDGAQLSARIRLPVDAEHLRPVPAILEYIPYRKDDHYLVILQDPVRHNYLAGHGYASVRVDIRGSGPSDGIMCDEYLKQEQDDALEVIEWFARQPWCTGGVGMFGISWGGFNSLQVAARRPSALKGIISIMGTDDRYALDVHYMGGCLLAFDVPWWATTLLAYNARPVDPYYAREGEDWRAKWLDRMEKTSPYLNAWMSHQRKDAFWKHGSVRENYADVECPVYLVVGWNDVYPDAKLRLLEGLSVPRKGLFGPWAHQYPEVATPGPAIGFLQESLRWWDHWLKGIDTGITHAPPTALGPGAEGARSAGVDEPAMRSYVLDTVPPGAFSETWPGRWIAEPAWPPPEDHLQPRDYYLGNETLDDVAGPERQFDHHSSQFAGLETGMITAYGTASELAPDQRADDGLSLAFTSNPLAERLEFMGFPEVTLSLTVDKPIALVAARLCAIAPTGESTLISRGMLNLTHRDGDENPAALEPGKRYTVKFKLKSTAYAVPPGYRLRIGLTSTHWPNLWPSPEPVTLTVYAGGPPADAAGAIAPPRRFRAERRALPRARGRGALAGGDAAHAVTQSQRHPRYGVTPGRGGRLPGLWAATHRRQRARIRIDAARFVLDHRRPAALGRGALRLQHPLPARRLAHSRARDQPVDFAQGHGLR